MLKTIEDVIEYYDEKKNKFKYNYGATIQKRKIPFSDLKKISTFGLPNSYLQFIGKYKVEGVSIGYLSFNNTQKKS